MSLSDTASKAEWAARYANSGLPIFPVWPIRNAECACPHGDDCPSPGKHPITPNGFYDATDDVDQIERWWRETPDANIALVTGRASGLDALDNDPRNFSDGVDPLDEIKKIGQLDMSLATRTGGGGQHIFIQYHGGARALKSAPVMAGLDYKSDGGFVLLPPSNHMSGVDYSPANGYVPGEVEAPEAPEWLLNWLCQTQSRRRNGNRNAEPGEDGDQAIPEGTRNDELFRIGCAIRRGGLGVDEIESSLVAVNRRRCKPPLGAKEIRGIAQSAATYKAGKLELVKFPSPASSRSRDDDDGDEPSTSTEPLAELLDGPTLLKTIKAEFCRFLVLTPAQSTLLTLWVVATHYSDEADVAPYVDIRGATKRTGKTLLLQVLARLVKKAELISGASVSSLFRMIEADRPVLLYDELDKSIDPKRGGDLDLLQVFTVGYSCDGTMLRSEPAAGGGFRQRRFSVFCFKAFTSIRRLPDELQDRSIPIIMKRKLRTEAVERGKRRNLAKLYLTAKSITRWADEHRASVTARYNKGAVTPAGLSDRQSDVMDILFVIADEVGDGWLARAIDAAKEVFAANNDEDEDVLAVTCLRDVVAILDTTEGGMPLKEVLYALNHLPDSPWGDFGKNGLTTRGLTKYLKDFGLPAHRDRVLWIDGKSVRGIRREWLTDAHKRWIIPYPPKKGKEGKGPPEVAENKGTKNGKSLPLGVSGGEGEGKEGACVCQCHTLELKWCGRCLAVHRPKSPPKAPV